MSNAVQALQTNLTSYTSAPEGTDVTITHAISRLARTPEKAGKFNNDRIQRNGAEGTLRKLGINFSKAALDKLSGNPNWAAELNAKLPAIYNLMQSIRRQLDNSMTSREGAFKQIATLEARLKPLTQHGVTIDEMRIRPLRLAASRLPAATRSQVDQFKAVPSAPRPAPAPAPSSVLRNPPAPASSPLFSEVAPKYGPNGIMMQEDAYLQAKAKEFIRKNYEELQDPAIKSASKQKAFLTLTKELVSRFHTFQRSLREELGAGYNPNLFYVPTFEGLEKFNLEPKLSVAGRKLVVITD